MYSNKKRRRIKPFARPTSFDFNAVFDLRHYQKTKYGAVSGDKIYPATVLAEDFQIMEGEVLMQKNDSTAVRRYGDHQMHCFGFASGLTSKQKDGKNKHVDALLQLKYAGVAVTGFKPEVDIYEQGFVVTVAGLNTLFNNGEHSIYPGDLICADVPPCLDEARSNYRNNAQGGIPGTKFQFTVTPYDKLIESIDGNTMGVDAREMASKFIMGTAMSFSKKGSPVDVVLHRCNVITRSAKTKTRNKTSSSSSVSTKGSGSSKPRRKGSTKLGD